MTGRPWNDDDLVIGGLVVLAGGFACGVGTVLLVRNNPGGSFAGSSTLGGVALLVAGWLAITVGLAVYRRHRASRFAILLIAAGFAWFIAEWINPAAGSSLVFTTGLLLYATCPPLVAHAALAYPRGRLRSPIEAVAVAAAYIGTLLVLGLGPALVFEPAEQGCTQCAANLVAITNDPQLVATLNRAGVRLGVVWAAALTGLSLWRVARSTPATRRATAGVLVPAIVYLGAVTATYLHSLERGVLSNDDVDRRLWLIQAGSLTFVALGTIIEWVRARRARAAVAEMVVRLAEAPPPGGLRAALATTLGDTDLQIAYPVLDGHHVDADANPVAPVAGPGRATTALVHDGDTIAVLIHRDDLLGDAKLVEQAAAAAQLALENERLHAQAQAQLVDLRASRARLVAASDHERRRLERDLHDGAQQHLVGVTLALRLIRTRLEQADSPTLATRVAAAETELHQAVDELRQCASGIHPAVLTDYGLFAAIRALAETSPSALRLVTPGNERFPAAVETAAYLVVAEAVKVGPACVTIMHRDNKLTVDLDAAGALAHVVDLEDRLGALDGTIATEPTADGVNIRAEIPCE
jgi:signal transduction histidine kinase